VQQKNKEYYMEDKIILHIETYAEIEWSLVDRITRAETEKEKERLKKIYLNWVAFKNQLVMNEDLSGLHI
jgi:hypothetical protein